MLVLLRASRASPAATPAPMMAAAAAVRSKPTRLASIVGFSSSGGRRRKGGRRGEAMPQPQPQPQPRRDETARKKKFNARQVEERKGRTMEEAAQGLQRQEGERRKKPLTPLSPPLPPRKQQQQKKEKVKRVVRWKCATGCGACCKLDKGPDFPTPEEIFADHPDDLQLYKSMIGTDGWCTKYDKSTRTCTIYQERPIFCRVEPKVFEEYFGVPSRPSTFDREACSACVDTIKMVYGEDSVELTNFKCVIREESKEHEASKNQDKMLDT
ncbi:hypothetical protein GUJ93_ZPchr0013g35860 [Zizania palustris]|uniref:Uncharacterized protein n=1 Tax=Zizania palustris TaxID=103762 RepID=A0A8J6BWC1_ZIZPA|nr:hypothetical protein GUJ93_ZPchr0013g35860 [Zizania palustris]KAG8097394.1 hypothetical protein GUJ93_ZPchr0013g35860 [Zizania palustris]